MSSSHFRQVFDEAWTRLANHCRECADRHDKGQTQPQDFQRFKQECALFERHFISAFSDIPKAERADIRKLVALLRSIGKDDFSRNARRVAHRLEQLRAHTGANARTTTSPRAVPGQSRKPAPAAAPTETTERGLKRPIGVALVVTGSALLLFAIAWVVWPHSDPAPTIVVVANDHPPPTTTHAHEQAPSDNPPASSYFRPALAPRVNLLQTQVENLHGLSTLMFLEWLDQRFSRAPEGREIMEHVLAQSMDADAPWRKSGVPGALAAVIAVHSGLAAYPSSSACLPSEVVKEQGAEPLPLGLAWWYMAARLGLDCVEVQIGTAPDGSTVIAPRLANGVIFYADTRELHSRSFRGIEACVLDLALRLVMREAEHGNTELFDTLPRLAQMGADPATLTVLKSRFRTAWLSAPARTPHQQQRLLQLLLEATPAEIGDTELLAALDVLGSQAHKHWLEQVFLRRGNAMLDERSVAEDLLMRALAQSIDDERWLHDLMSQAIALTPSRERGLYAMLRDANRLELMYAVALKRYEAGERGAATLTLLAEREMRASHHLAALACIALMPETWDMADLAVARQGIALAIDFQQLESGRRIARGAEARWPDDPGISRLFAELEITCGSREEGVRRLRAHLERFPDDRAVKARLEELSLAS